MWGGKKGGESPPWQRVRVVWRWGGGVRAWLMAVVCGDDGVGRGGAGSKDEVR